jgi:hypothetical protein
MSARRCALACAVWSALAAAPAQAQAPRHLAVIVGANAAPEGRRSLRYSHDDARRVADVLTHVAGFDPADVTMLLDPAPRAVLDALDRALREAAAAQREAVLLFYYSGHADDHALYPGGLELPLARLRSRLDDPRAKVRVGIIDACRGGGWTGTKGLAPAEPFDVDMPLGLSNQGSILIASSSGEENAHESEALHGSFFTHHWNGGLRGAADRNGDGRVTVGEAFEYARTLTIRDTALVAKTPQHPSFLMNLGGRQDLTLVSLEARRSVLVIEQVQGPLELVHLDSGLVVLESGPGRTLLRLGVSPGRYLVRRRDPAGVWAAQLDVPADGETRVAEARLELVRPAALAAKDGLPRVTATAIVPPGHWDFALALGVRHARGIDPGLRFGDVQGDYAGIVRATYGLAPGWHFALPLAVAHGGRAAAGWEWVAWGGLPVLGASHADDEGAIVNGVLGAGIDFRHPVGGPGALNLGANALGSFRWAASPLERCAHSKSPCTPALPGDQPPSTWTLQMTAGYSHTVGDAVTFNLAAGVAGNGLFDGAWSTVGWREPTFDPVIAFGSVQRRGLRQQPLIRIHLDDALALDVHVVVAYAFAARTLAETYMGGVSWLW